MAVLSLLPGWSVASFLPTLAALVREGSIGQFPPSLLELISPPSNVELFPEYLYEVAIPLSALLSTQSQPPDGAEPPPGLCGYFTSGDLNLV